LNEAVDGAIVGSDTYNKLLEDVFDAKEKEREASERLTDAVDRETEAYERLAEAIKTASDAAKNTGRTGSESSQRCRLCRQPTSTTVPSDIRGGTGANITINTGIGTNGIEAGRQIVQLLQQYTAVDAFAIDRLGFAPRR
jgi:hypothetical protein